MSAGYYTFETDVNGAYFLDIPEDISCDQGNIIVYDGEPIELSFGGWTGTFTINASLINVENKISTSEAWIEAGASYNIDLE